MIKQILTFIIIFIPLASDDCSYEVYHHNSNENTVPIVNLSEQPPLEKSSATLTINNKELRDKDSLTKNSLSDILDTKKIEKKETFHDVLNDFVFQVSYAITSLPQMVGLFFGYIAGILHTNNSFDNQLFSLLPKKYHLIPSYLPEADQKTIQETSQPYIAQYFTTVNKNSKNIGKLGVENLKTIASSIIHEYDATRSLDELLAQNENYNTIVTSQKMNDDAKMKMHSSIIEYIKDLHQLKAHSRYSILYREFIQNISREEITLQQMYDSFYVQNISKHKLNEKDYSLMMQYFLDTMSSNNDQGIKYLFKDDINHFLTNKHYIQQSYAENYNKLSYDFKLSQMEEKILYNDLIANNTENFLRLILDKGLAFGKLARYGVIAISSLFLTVVGGASALVVVGGNYVNTELMSKNFYKQNFSIESTLSKLNELNDHLEPTQNQADSAAAKTVDKIVKIHQDFKDTHEFKVMKNLIPSIGSGHEEDLKIFNNARSLIAIKPQVMQKIIDQASSKLYSKDNLKNAIQDINKNLDIPFMSKNYDTFGEKTKKLFNKYLDIVLNFALKNDNAFHRITDEDKKNLVNNYLQSSAQIILTASYNIFYEDFKADYTGNTSDNFNQIFEKFWAKNKYQYIYNMNSQRFINQKLYNENDDKILKEECREYCINEFYKVYNSPNKFYDKNADYMNANSQQKNIEINSLYQSIKSIPI